MGKKSKSKSFKRGVGILLALALVIPLLIAATPAAQAFEVRTGVEVSSNFVHQQNKTFARRPADNPAAVKPEQANATLLGGFGVTTLPAETVLVGPQDGKLYAGTEGKVKFPVTTVGIADGDYDVTVENLPDGVTVLEPVTISDDAGMLTLAGDSSTIEGSTASLVMTLAGVASNDFTLVVSPVPAAPVITSDDNTRVVFGAGGIFKVTAAGATPITFTLTGAPEGVSINDTSGIMAISVFTAVGTHTFTITASNDTSPDATQTFSLVVDRIPIVNAIINVTAPVSGNTPVTAAMISGGTGFTAGAVTWTPGDAVFAAGIRYTATVTLTARADYTFADGLTGTVTINGNTATVSNNGAKATLSYRFAATAATVPGAPRNFTAAAGDGQVALSWTAPANTGGSAITGYAVSLNGGTSWIPLGAVTTHTFTGLQNGIAHIFMIRAFNGVGGGTAVSVTATPGASPPKDDVTTAPPANLVPAGDDGAVSVNFTRSGSTVVLDLTRDTVNDIISNSGGDVANIDLSDVPRITGATMPVSALSQIADAGLGLKIVMPRGMVSIDAAALTSVAEQAESEDVSLMFDQVGQAALTQAQRNALNTHDIIFGIQFISGTRQLSDFNGFLTATLPYNGPLPVAVWYLDSEGNLMRMDSEYDPIYSNVTFTTNHLSKFVVGPDTEAVNGDTQVTGGADYEGAATDPGAQARIGGNLAFWVVIICIAAAAGVFAIRKSQVRENKYL